MATRLRRYKPRMDHSYALGVYPTIELLTHRPDKVCEVVVCSTESLNDGIATIRAACKTHGIPVAISDKTLLRLSNRPDCHAAGVFRKYDCKLARAGNHVVLVEPNDMGNVGTIMRTMLACGFTDLALIRPTPDMFAPKAVRASMGAVFQVSHEYFDSFAEYRNRFPRQMYTLMIDGETPLREAEFKSPYALVFGNEGAGLGEEYRALGRSLHISQTNRVDSLNLAVAVGITLYEAASRSR